MDSTRSTNDNGAGQGAGNSNDRSSDQGAGRSTIADGNRLSPYATPTATREVLERHGLYTKYALGQNFLVNDGVVRKIIELADVCSSDHVLEVGPGIGTLTAALLQYASHVTAIEMDYDLPNVLADTLEPWWGSFTLLTMDALDVTVNDLEQFEDAPIGELGAEALPNKLVSNLPYAVAATVALDYLQKFDSLDSATIMIQREVAERMMAKPGTKAYGAYTVKLSMYAQVAGQFPVSAGNFFPPPRVESTVIRLNRVLAHDESGRELSSDELRSVCAMADAAFATRRKTLANSCKTHFSGRAGVLDALPQIFERADVDPRRRGETLDRREFIQLGLAFHEAVEGGSGR